MMGLAQLMVGLTCACIIPLGVTYSGNIKGVVELHRLGNSSHRRVPFDQE